MLYLFVLVFVSFVQDMSAQKYECNPRELCGCSRGPLRPKIIHGENASNYTWSWTISLRDRKGHFCGGSILNEKYVITAAHCFHGRMDILSSIVICAGTIRLSATCSQSRKIQNLTNHPSYKRATFENDIALIQVNAPFNFTDISIARICLPNIIHDKKYPTPGTNVTTVGWGKTETSDHSDTLQEVTVQVVDQFQNNCDYKSVSYNHNIKLCATAPGKGKTRLFNRCFSFISSLFLSSSRLCRR